MVYYYISCICMTVPIFGLLWGNYYFFLPKSIKNKHHIILKEEYCFNLLIALIFSTGTVFGLLITFLITGFGYYGFKFNLGRLSNLEKE